MKQIQNHTDKKKEIHLSSIAFKVTFLAWIKKQFLIESLSDFLFLSKPKVFLFFKSVYKFEE